MFYILYYWSEREHLKTNNGDDHHGFIRQKTRTKRIQ